MKKIVIIIVVATLVALFVSCSGNLPPVQVIGGRNDLQGLVGHWAGTYEVTRGQLRRGEVYLLLDAEKDTARGQVIMTVLTSRPQNRPPANMLPAPMTVPAQVLSIRFVRVDGDIVNGVLDPYKDDFCGCILTTKFVGRLRGDTISGTFDIRHSDSLERESGHWLATRSAAK